MHSPLMHRTSAADAQREVSLVLGLVKVDVLPTRWVLDALSPRPDTRTGGKFLCVIDVHSDYVTVVAGPLPVGSRGT